jgi:hypothetical protein
MIALEREKCMQGPSIFGPGSGSRKRRENIKHGVVYPKKTKAKTIDGVISGAAWCRCLFYVQVYLWIHFY